MGPIATELMSAEQLAEYRAAGSPQDLSLSTIDVYRTDAVLVRSYKPACAGSDAGRGKIGAAPSPRSLQRLVFLLNNSDVPFLSMFTFTMTPHCSRTNSVDRHRAMLRNILQRLRDHGVGQYCWVREFQGNASVHWHVFTDKHVGKPGEVNNDLTDEWSHWFATSYYRGKTETEAAKASRYRMIHGNGADFRGCCRVEQLRSHAAGRYAGKEGAKRFQKRSPERWRNGGAWWRPSRNVKCTPIKTVSVYPSTIKESSVTLPDGRILSVPNKIQFCRGLKELSREK